ncbi:MAG TPA: alpha/beta hydrolase [Aliidongia sp.]|uniref:alpha/beta fold hydrolase n=1 Tax=Aliidongia sp. TaxID=1914230 RepID=UPI002DDD2E33|nr:alpha/beta hydrolase [Aliidongia sp.]HEV2674389.1 alpha/beta hydrolase [Aliidongia sp.]
MPFIETDDETTLFYNDWGVGKPVVLIHGWPLNADMWEYQATFLAEQGFRVIAYDRRGFGRSDQPWNGYDYDTLADDLAAILEELALDDVTLVGFSMGGGEVARYLARHGAARVSKAALISAVTPLLVKRPDHEDGVDIGVFDKMIAGLREDRPSFLAGFGKQFFGAGLLNLSISSEVLAWAQGMAMQGSPKATLDCVRAFSETDFRADMAAFTMPTLIVHGDADATVPIDVAGRAAARLIPTAVLKEYEGAAHGLFFTEKDRLNADLLAFIGE